MATIIEALRAASDPWGAERRPPPLLLPLVLLSLFHHHPDDRGVASHSDNAGGSREQRWQTSAGSTLARAADNGVTHRRHVPGRQLTAGWGL